MEYSVTKGVTKRDEVTESSHECNNYLTFVDFAKQ